MLLRLKLNIGISLITFPMRQTYETCILKIKSLGKWNTESQSEFNYAIILMFRLLLAFDSCVWLHCTKSTFGRAFLLLPLQWCYPPFYLHQHICLWILLRESFIQTIFSLFWCNNENFAYRNKKIKFIGYTLISWLFASNLRLELIKTFIYIRKLSFNINFLLFMFYKEQLVA